jgi:hypothetical protein
MPATHTYMANGEHRRSGAGSKTGKPGAVQQRAEISAEFYKSAAAPTTADS